MKKYNHFTNNENLKIRNYRNYLLKDSVNMAKSNNLYCEDVEFYELCKETFKTSDYKKFNEHLDSSLLLNNNGTLLIENCDENGDFSLNEMKIMDILSSGEDFFKNAVDFTVKKAEGFLNVFAGIAKTLIGKFIAFVKSLMTLDFSKIRDKIMTLLSVLCEKIVGGIKKFGKFIQKNNKSIYKILIKIVSTLSISSIVSYILSYFGAGWAIAMGVKMGVTAATKKTKDKIANKIVDNKVFKYLKSYSLFEEQENKEGVVKKVLFKLGNGIKTLFSILKKIKIGIIVFAGVIFILSLIFDPIFDPIVDYLNLSKFSDIWNMSFSGDGIPEVKASENLVVNKDAVIDMKAEIKTDNEDARKMAEEWSNDDNEKVVETQLAKVDIQTNQKEASESLANLSNELIAELKTSDNGSFDTLVDHEKVDLTETETTIEEYTKSAVENIVNKKGWDVKNLSDEQIEFIKTEMEKDQIYDIDKESIHNLFNDEKVEVDSDGDEGTQIEKPKVEDIKVLPKNENEIPWNKGVDKDALNYAESKVRLGLKDIDEVKNEYVKLGGTDKEITENDMRKFIFDKYTVLETDIDKNYYVNNYIKFSGDKSGTKPFDEMMAVVDYNVAKNDILDAMNHSVNYTGNKIFTDVDMQKNLDNITDEQINSLSRYACSTGALSPITLSIDHPGEEYDMYKSSSWSNKYIKDHILNKEKIKELFTVKDGKIVSK